MPWPWREKPRRKHAAVVFEATTRCNHDCPHCYNAWKNPVGYPEGELETGATLAMLGKLLDESGASLVTVSGGEPLLRADIFEIVAYIAERGKAVNFLTNGTLLDERAIARLSPGKVSVFEVPLLSSDRAIHDAMSAAPGAFEKVTLAVANLKAAGQRVVCVFVATRVNLPTWRQTAEVAVALGADGIMFNRFNPGGRGRENVPQLQAGPDDLSAAMEIAEQITQQYGISISCSIPMPPCLFDHSKYPHLGFGFCAAGTDRAYYTVDPLGNVRPCNHSTLILGNIRATGFWEMVDSSPMSEFVSARPGFCSGCKLELTCLGGCKASAEVCSGSAWAHDPLLDAFSWRARKVE